MSTTNVMIRMDEELKKQAEELFSDFGLTLEEVLTVFIKQSVREQRIPFILTRSLPNVETIAAIEEVDRMKSEAQVNKGYTDVDGMMRDLLK